MGLTDVISGVMEEFDKRKDKSDVWEKLRKKLKKKGFKEGCDKITAELGDEGAYEFLEVWDALDEHLNKSDYNWNKYDNIRSIKEVSKISNIKETIKFLGEAGYALPYYKEESNIYVNLQNGIQFFKMFEEKSLHKKCASVFKALKNLNYKDINSYITPAPAQLDYIIRIACFKDDVAGAIYILASKGYKIDETIGINKLDSNNIKKITEEGKESIPVYLYNEGNAKLFQEYFNGLEAEKKKSVLKSVLDYETKTGSEGSNNRKQNREWLEKDYTDLLREVGFED